MNIDALKIARINELVPLLNKYRDSYYNNSTSEISDKEYDDLFDELKQLEDETQFILLNSPTQQVGYSVVSKLNKVKHNHPMLSLDKTKDINEIFKFLDNKDGIVMAKMDGLTCSLRYVHGILVSAETRGDGETGEDILHNAWVLKSIPKTLNTHEKEVIIDGEVICDYTSFNEINSQLAEEAQYKHIRNYASGSIRQLDNKICEERKLTFVAWKFVKGSESNSFSDRLFELISLGFVVAPFIKLNAPELTSLNALDLAVLTIKKTCEARAYPIDGCVFGFDDVEYGESLGSTSHHVRSQMAFKFYNETVPSTLQFVDWTIGKTGVLTPTAVFSPVVIEGTTITRASLHNISIMRTLGLRKRCTVNVYKANQIIPQIESCEDDGELDAIEIPMRCPYCNSVTEIVKENASEVLCCSNPDCTGKKQMLFNNFVSRKCANIDGMSEATTKFLYEVGFISTYKDLYHLSDKRDLLSSYDGFGETSIDNLLASIERSRHIKLANFINALSIDGVGLATAKIIAKQFDNDVNKLINALDDNFNFTVIDGFGESTNNAIYTWYAANKNMLKELVEEFVFEKDEINSSDNSLSGIKFCITGSFADSRDEIKERLERKGAIFVSSVSKKLDVLFVGENEGSKLDKAKSLGIKIVEADELYAEYLV